MNTFPSASIKTTRFVQTPEIEQYLIKRLESLEKFLPAEEADLLCDVELEQLATHQTGKIFRAEVNLRVGGKLFRAEATEDQMETAIDVVKNELKRELRRHNSKKQSLVRRGAQKMKRMMRFGRGD